ncbi:MAG: hypothetical protein HY587_02265 [Candidatus Omnitrophica bacterium]|nr:hypothetical protein [Candidatus Omnitrophota bacterium]
MIRIAIFHATAGEGHRKVAEAVASELKILLNGDAAIECLDALDYTNAFFKKSYPAVYHFLVTKVPRLWGMAYELFDRTEIFWIFRLFRRWFNSFHAAKLERYLREKQFDAVISTHFLAAETTAALKKAGKISSVIHTVITDFSAHMLWVNPGTDYYAVMHPDTVETAVRRGAPRGITYVTGIPVNREFHEFSDRDEVLKSLGLAPSGKKTLMITSGGFGLGPTEPILRCLEKFSDEVQVIVVCGKNVELKERLSRLQTPLAMKVLGFVDYMPKLMSVCDLVISKAGGSTICECLAKGLPLAIFSFIPGQEERNVRMLLKYNAARIIGSPEEVNSIVDDLLHNPDVMKAWREGIRSMAKPFAAREVAEFTKSIVESRKK